MPSKKFSPSKGFYGFESDDKEFLKPSEASSAWEAMLGKLVPRVLAITQSSPMTMATRVALNLATATPQMMPTS